MFKSTKVTSILLACAYLGMAVAYAEAPKVITIPAGELNSALESLVEQTGIQLLYDLKQVEGLRTPGVKDAQSPQAAVSALLKGTPLTTKTDASGAILIAAPVATPSIAADLHTTSWVGPQVRVAQSDSSQTQIQSENPSSPENKKSDSPTSEGESGNLEEIVVTGTHIRGVYPQSSPLSIYTADDIRHTGVTTIEQFIQKLPQNHGTTFGGAPGAAGGFNPEAATGIDLRGLGIGTTLVLVNGRRLALAAAGRTADISMIPLGALARVEVLTDGASGIYGADAVGGVVNLVLKEKFEGAQTDLGYGSVTDGGLDELQVGQTFGHRWSSGHAMVSYHYLDRTDLDASERDFSASAAPYTLALPDRRNSVFLSGRQDGPAGISLFGDALYSSRETNSLATHLTGAINRAHTDEKQYFADLGGRREIAGSLAGELVASYSKLKSNFKNAETSPFGDADQVSDFEHSVLDVTAKLDGDVLGLPGGMLKFSAGGGYTKERYTQEGLINGAPTSPLKMDRNTKYAFGELFAPFVSPQNEVALVERLELSLSARYTDYSDFGSETSPRVGLLWAPASFLNLRATYSESFRAPSLVQLDPAGSQNVIFPPAAFGFPDPFSSDGSTVVLIPQGVGAARLDPEKAQTYTVGFDVQPQSMPGLKLSASYFKIDYRGRILAPFSFAEPFVNPQNYGDVIYLNPNADLIRSVIAGTTNFFNATNVDPTDPEALAGVIDVILDQRTRNLALSKMDGIDFSIDRKEQVRFGSLSLGAQVAYLLNYDQQNTKSAPVLSILDTVLQPVAVKGRAYIGASRGILSGQIGLNYVDRYHNPFSAEPTTVSSWTTVDLNVSCDFGNSTMGLLAGTRISLSAQNLFDRNPPFVAVGVSGSTVNEEIGYDPTNANPIGRFISAQVSRKW